MTDRDFQAEAFTLDPGLNGLFALRLHVMIHPTVNQLTEFAHVRDQHVGPVYGYSRVTEDALGTERVECHLAADNLNTYVLSHEAVHVALFMHAMTVGHEPIDPWSHPESIPEAVGDITGRLLEALTDYGYAVDP